MPTEDELREMDINAAEAQLKDQIDQLDALRNNPEVSQYAAEDYIEEAIPKLEAAVADLERARNE